MKLNFRQRLLATTLIVGASALAAPAYAQDIPPADTEDTTLDPAQGPATGPIESQPVPESSAQGEPVEQPQDIIVTGSRIPQPNLESAAPVTVVSNQDIKLSGATRVEDVLNSLPSVVAAQASGVANGATGTAEVDLRGMGSNRTLVLVNGRRLVPGDPSPTSGSSADLNFIPSALVKRIEVLTGGASSTYGADAVAGVVNFIMDTDFRGIRVDGNYGFYNHNNHNDLAQGLIEARQAQGLPGFEWPNGNVTDGGAFDATVSLGAGFDDGRGNVVAYFGYRKVRPVLQSRRDFSACVITSTSGGNPQCGGSATSAEGNVIIYDTFETDDGQVITSTFYTFLPDRTIENTNTVYNFGPLNYFQRPDERYVGGAFANYEVSEQIKPYLEFMFMDDRSLAQIAPSGNFANTYTINCDNPLMSEQQRDIICDEDNLVVGFLGNYPLVAASNEDGDPDDPLVFTDPTTGATYNRAFFQPLRRNVEGGPRIADLKHTAFRGVIGSRGDLSDAWSYDGYFQYGRTNFSLTYRNEFSIQKLLRANDVIDDPRTPDVVDPICRSVLDGTDLTCQPYDYFGGRGAASDAAVAYLNTAGLQSGYTSEQVGNLSFTGLLGQYGLQTPWAEDGAAINVGAEYRKETVHLDTDEAFQQGDLTGQGAPTLPIDGGFRVLEWFAEAQFPLVQRSFIEDLTLSAGFRRSYYKTTAGREYDTNTYKLAAEFAPIRDFRIRGAYNRAVRAPNVQELFSTNFVGLDGSDDPCADITITATDYGCLAQGLDIGDRTPGNPAGQYNGLLGGNVDLRPETATTKTVGVVLEPRFIPRFALTVDYFDIEVDGAIRGPGADAILSHCVDNATATFTPESCGFVQRDAAGSIWLTPQGFVVDTPINTGGLTVRGFEFNGGYSHRLGGLGNLSASFVGTLLKDHITDNGLTDPYDCVGYVGPTCSGGGTSASGGAIPKWRHKARLTLNTPQGIGLSVQWRHIGAVDAETLSENESLNGEFNFNPGLNVKAYNYIDLATTFTVGDNYNFRMGVNNIFDKDPPLFTGGSSSRSGSNLCPAGPCNGNTYPGTWDALGRYVYVGATLDF